jgi:hypothetical protein
MPQISAPMCRAIALYVRHKCDGLNEPKLAALRGLSIPREGSDQNYQADKICATFQIEVLSRLARVCRFSGGTLSAD